MIRYYIFRDGKQEANAATREQAMRIIRQLQAEETHYILKANFSIIAGEEEFIPYEKSGHTKKG